MADERRYCSVYVGPLLFGIEVTRVQEVLFSHEMIPVPLAPRAVEGLLNLRGQIVTALDLRRVLGMEDRPAGQLPVHVVMRSTGDPVSLLVDRIDDVIVVEGEVQAVPETLSGVSREVIRGAVAMKERLLLVLDVDKISCKQP